MNPIASVIQTPPVRERKPNSERAEMIGQLLEFMNEEYTQRRFQYWLGRTKHLSPSEIYIMMRQARDGHTPPALFQYLLKKSKETA